MTAVTTSLAPASPETARDAGRLTLLAGRPGAVTRAQLPAARSPTKETFIVMYQPPSTAGSDYFPYIIRNGTHLLAYPDGDVLSGQGSADDGPGLGHRSSRRAGCLRRLLHRRPPPGTTNADLDTGLDAGKDAGLEPRSAEYRALHRAQGAQRAQPAKRAEQPGISWGRAGPARLSGRPSPALSAGPDATPAPAKADQVAAAVAAATRGSGPVRRTPRRRQHVRARSACHRRGRPRGRYRGARDRALRRPGGHDRRGGAARRGAVRERAARARHHRGPGVTVPGRRYLLNAADNFDRLTFGQQPEAAVTR